MLLLFFFDINVDRSTVVPLVHTFLWKEVSKEVSSEEVDDLHRVLKDKEMREQFKKFATSEFSIENVLFYGVYLKKYQMISKFRTIRKSKTIDK